MDDLFTQQAPVPANFDAENAENLEDVRHPYTSNQPTCRMVSGLKFD
jgi:hypothetical protein